MSTKVRLPVRQVQSGKRASLVIDSMTQEPNRSCSREDRRAPVASAIGVSRRDFFRQAGLVAGTGLVHSPTVSDDALGFFQGMSARPVQEPADYTIKIAATPVEVAPGKFISATTYNGQFPGPLLRFKEGRRLTIDLHNETDTPEQLHWHGQSVPTDVDGAAEEGTPFIPARGSRRISFVPRPAGYRFFHTHNRAGADLSAGVYSGQVGQVYIEPSHEPGAYDREVFLVLKEFAPTISQGGDMPQDVLTPATDVPALKAKGEAAMKASLARGTPKGFEVG